MVLQIQLGLLSIPNTETFINLENIDNYAYQEQKAKSRISETISGEEQGELESPKCIVVFKEQRKGFSRSKARVEKLSRISGNLPNKTRKMDKNEYRTSEGERARIFKERGSQGKTENFKEGLQNFNNRLTFREIRGLSGLFNSRGFTNSSLKVFGQLNDRRCAIIVSEMSFKSPQESKIC